MRRLISSIALGMICGMVAPVAALEITGEETPTYLETEFRPRWKMTPLIEVAESLAEELDLPVVLSEELSGSEDRVYLTEDRRRPLRDTLTLLERAQFVHIRAEPLRLVIESPEEALERQRRSVAIDLGQIATLKATRDHFTDMVIATDPGGGGFALFAGDSDDGFEHRGFTPDDILDMIANLTDGSGGISVGGMHWLRLTPEEEAAIRSHIEQVDRDHMRPVSVIMRSGVVATDKAPSGGLIPREQARELATQLALEHTLFASGLMNQRLAASDTQHSLSISDADVAGNSQLDPVVENLAAGRSAQVRVSRGQAMIHLALALDWAEIHDDRGQATITGQATPQTREASADITDEKATVRVDLQPPTPPSSDQVAIDLIPRWRWQPRIDIGIMPEQAVITTAPHAEGTAILIVWIEGAIR